MTQHADIEPLWPNRDYTPERVLWAAALRQLIEDAKCYWRGSKWHQDTEYEQAFDDLCRCGPMTRYCCQWLDCQPMSISLAFVRWCEQWQEQDVA